MFLRPNIKYFILAHFLVTTSYAASNIESSNVIYQDSAKSASESANYYRNLAREYQLKADFYSGMAGIYESVPALTFAESGNLQVNPYQSLNSKGTLNTNCDKENIVPKYNPWKGTQFSFGGGGTTGNTNTSNAQGNLVINYKPSESDAGWNFNTLGQYDYLYSSSDGIQKNRLYLQQNGYYMFNKYNGMFAQASYLNDALDGYYFVWNENIGYQLQLFKTENQNLLLSVGPGLQERQLQIANSPYQTIPSWLIQFTYNLAINKTITFTEQLQNIATTLNTTTYSISALTIQAYKNIGIGLNYQITYNTAPEPGKSAVSSISGVTFVYSLN